MTNHLISSYAAFQFVSQPHDFSREDMVVGTAIMAIVVLAAWLLGRLYR